MISVLLAAYCGEDFIAEQIASILPQLEDGDELLVSDDSPEGHTATRDAVLAFDDPRICYVAGPRRGVIKNVAFLLGQARGGILVLCDQDDVWLPGKLAKLRAAGGCHATPTVWVHAAKIVDEALRETGQVAVARPGLLRNLLKNSYTGCCMAFTRELLPCVQPFPADIPMHDWWIGLRAERFGRVCVLDEPLILWRRHRGTQTGRGGTLKQKMIWRWRMVSAIWRQP